MSRVIHTGQALVDVVVEVPDLPVRGQNVMAASATDYAGGAVTVLVAAARFGAACVHAECWESYLEPADPAARG